MTDAAARIGFMQGRLSAQVNGRIQAFPWDRWREEFPRAAELGVGVMEWTLDQEWLRRNPLLTSDGRAEIMALSVAHSVAVPSLTGDCFMQAPLWKAGGGARRDLEADFFAVCEAASQLGIGLIVVPLVDNGRLEDDGHLAALTEFFFRCSDQLRQLNLRVAFETDADPLGVQRLMSELDPRTCGVNYDIGNSAAAGFDPREEIACYGARILNVHVKDRKLGGGTVPLGTGDADFHAVFESLAAIDYKGNYILQTARATDGDHARVLGTYRAMTQEWITAHES